MSTTVVAPIWLIKTRLQLQTNEMKRQGLAYSGSLDCIRRVYKEEGLRGFYKGLAASYLGKPTLLFLAKHFANANAKCDSHHDDLYVRRSTTGMAGLAIQFSLYEKGKKLLLSRTHRSSRGNASPPPPPSFFVLYSRLTRREC